jgi:hypothetical protein
LAGLVMSLVISRVGSSRPMFLMAIWRTLLLMPRLDSVPALP